MNLDAIALAVARRRGRLLDRIADALEGWVGDADPHATALVVVEALGLKEHKSRECVYVGPKGAEYVTTYRFKSLES